jgi:hypothetical protein
MSKFGDESIYQSLVSVNREINWEIEYLCELITGTYYETDDQREGRSVMVTIDDTTGLDDNEIDEIKEFVRERI